MTNRSLDGLDRRTFLASAAGGVAAALAGTRAAAQDNDTFGLTYSLASCMYGKLPMADVVTAGPATDARILDLWPARHGNQREQLDEMGVDAFLALCDRHGVQPGIITRYDLGPMRLAPEFPVAQAIGATMIVTGSRKPADDVRAGIQAFVEDLKPHIEAAAEHGVTIAIENHGKAILDSPDSIRYFNEAIRGIPNVGVALAPYHLPQDPELLAGLIRELGPRLALFYAWEYGHGCSNPLPKTMEMQQMPGYGPLDFGPMLQALKDINYQGWTSIFMHPVPRGIPVLPTADETTDAINRSREYLTWKLEQLAA